MFTKLGLVSKIQPIISEAQQKGELATAAILSGLCGAMLMGREQQIMDAMRSIMNGLKDEAEREIRELTAGDAELKKVVEEMEQKMGIKLPKLEEDDFFEKNDIIQ